MNINYIENVDKVLEKKVFLFFFII